jgi:hypothetical protein
LAHWRTLLPTFFEDVFAADPANVLQIGFETVEKTASRRVICSASPSRHIYNPLTIAVAFRRSPAFDRVRQHPIKVDGTFA